MEYDSKSNVANVVSPSLRKSIAWKMLVSVLLVLVMVASPFAVVAYGEGQPTIWPSQDMYVPGETVKIFGKNWDPFSPVTIEMSHPDFKATKTYVVIPDIYGRFACDNYTAEGVKLWDTPVQVTASQNQDGVIVTATTSFKDPAVSLQGYTLKPNLGWTAGDIKGYNEGDSVPYKVTLDSKAFGSTVTVTLGFDYEDMNTVTYGIDFLVNAYHTDTPVAPFNIYTTPDANPFWVDPAEGTITNQVQLPNQFDSGSSRTILVWQFTLDFIASKATVRWGAHMALTDLTQVPPYYGASYFPGSSLHVRIVALDPSSNDGNRDVPIALHGAVPVLTPPEMTLTKECDPDSVVSGDTITFTVTWSNIGQADAACVELWDSIAPVATFIPSSFKWWTSENPTELYPTGIVITDFTWSWFIGAWRGTGENGADPPLVGYLEFQALITDDAVPGECYKNEVWLHFSDDHGGFFEDLYAFCEFCIPNTPSIDIVKTGPDCAHIGDEITYTYTVTNDGQLPLENVDIIDDVVGVIALDQTLAVGEVEEYTGTYTILATDPDPLPNTVTVTGFDEYGREVSDSDNWEVDILHPALDLVKSSEWECAMIGETVWYTITVSNPSSDTPLDDVTVEDTLLGVSEFYATLAPGESEEIVVSHTISASDKDPFVNTADAVGYDCLDVAVTASDSWTVDILHPMIEISKWADTDCAGVGDTVTYHIDVTNPSSDTDMYAEVSDPMLGGSLFTGWLIPGEVVHLGPYYFDVPSDQEWILNTATVNAWDKQDHFVSDESSWLVEIVHPAVNILKESELRCAAEGETVTYTITVTNTGDTPLSGYVQDLDTGFYQTFSDLAAGDSIQWTTSMDMPVGEEFTNTAWVYADDVCGHEVSDSSSWTVDIVHPAVEVTKTSDLKCAAEGETVTYTITVKNIGDIELDSGTVVDPMLLWSESFVDLLPGQSVSWDVSTVMPVGEEFVNTATVDALDRQGHPVSDSDSWTIDIVHPDVEITKWSALTCAAEGEVVDYVITVTNTGDINLQIGEVSDADTGFFDLFFDLAPGLSLTFDTSMAMPVGEVFTNTAVVEALDDQGHFVSDSDSWTVDIVHPGVEIVKYADNYMTCAAEGEVVGYTMIVTNTGDITLASGNVYDLDTGFTATFTDLAPGVSLEFHTTFAMPVGEEFINTAYVDALDLQGHPVSDSDFWIIDIVHPGVQIVKIADGRMTCAAEGELVLYTITVTNTGDIILESGSVEDLQTGMVASFNDLLPGQSVEFFTSTWMPVGEEFTNTADVVAWDLQGHEVSDSDSWTIDIVHPNVMITKVGDKSCAAEGEEVTYTITIKNTGDITLASGSVWDFQTGFTAAFYGLVPGAEITLTTSMDMPAQEEDFVNTVYVDAFDLQGHLVSDSSSWTVDVVHPQITVEKVGDKSCAAEGEMVTYTITVTNTGDILIAQAFVSDPLTGFTAAIYGLYVGGSVTFTTSIPMPVQTEDFVNTVYVDALDAQGHPVFGEASWTVDIVHPEVKITKSADKICAHEGEEIQYTILVENMGDTILIGTVYDDLAVFAIPFSLGIGDSLTIFYTYTVPLDPLIEWVINSAWVTAVDHQGHEVSARASWQVEILRPAIDVVKVGPDSANVGQTITYTVTVTNIGDTPLFDIVVEDSLVGDLGTINLDIGESATFNYDYVVPGGEGCLDNIVTATGHDKQDVYVSDSDDWCVFKNGKVSGLKFYDFNRDGIMDGGDQVIPGWLVTLTGPNGVDTRFTNPLGQFEFDGLAAGDYVLTESLPTGWVNTLPISHSFTVTSGSTFVFVFANAASGSICGSKFEDKNLNGIWDLGEPGVSGWDIYLDGVDLGGQVVSLHTVTDANGDYCFLDLAPGDYTVTEGDRDGWIPMTPGSVDIAIDVLEPFEVTGVNFGNAKTGCITGFKWLDEYMNGYRDGNEPRLAGWTIILDGYTLAGDHVHMETVTDASGYYKFCGLLPGDYTVSEVIPDGWVNITPASWDVTLIEGSEVTCAKFGNVELGCIDGWKFIDWDMDGLKDGNEPGIAGWQITLTGWLNDGDWPWAPQGATPVGPLVTYTDENGHWEFCDLLPGIYTVTEETKDGWKNITPLSHTLWIASGTHVVDVKFGNVPLVCIYGYKFNDLNANGVKDEGEPGLEGWTIILEGVDLAGNPVQIVMTTNADGYFATCFNVLPGHYVLYEIQHDGWYVTLPDDGVYAIDLVGGYSEPIRLGYDFGNVGFGKIHGWKYDDVNGNGVLDNGDKPIMGWKVTITLPWGGTGFTYTDVNGYFEFTGLPVGVYTVTEEDVAGWTHTSVTSYTVTVHSGEIVILPPFLNTQYGKICGFKFNDINGNGVWDDGEPPIEGWVFWITNVVSDGLASAVTDADGMFCFNDLLPGTYMIWEEEPPGWVPTTQTAVLADVESGSEVLLPDFGNFQCSRIEILKYNDIDGDGFLELFEPGMVWEFIVTSPSGIVTHVFTNPDGVAILEVCEAGLWTIEEVLVDGWTPTTPIVQYLDVLSGYVSQAVFEFGNFKCVDVTLFKYEDKNSNGVYDNDDVPIEGWMFTLFDILTGSTETVITGEDGMVQLHFCTAGDWIVTEELPDGWRIVTPEIGLYEIVVTSGMAINVFTLQEQYFYEFGNFHCVQILVFKYWDVCGNGWYDPDVGDVPLAGWIFNLYLWDPIEQIWVWQNSGITDQDGMLTFTVCSAGTYDVAEMVQDGWRPVNPYTGAYVIDVESGMDPIYLPYGNYFKVEIPIFKYEDKNSNGVYDNDDVPIEGWYFEMVRVGFPEVVYSGYTDEFGMLVFTVYYSGIYVITEETRAHWTAINPASGMSSVTVTSGTVVPLQMFGNFHNALITACKIDDVNANGEFDDGLDSMIEGWTFTLWIWDGELQDWIALDSKVTGEDGCVQWEVSASGLYAVTEESRDGWMWIYPTDGQYLFDVFSGDAIELLFFNFKKGTINGYKWNDLDGDGLHDAGEPGLPGWTVWFIGTPLGGGNPITGFAVTDANGFYQFTGLPPGEYLVYEVEQLGWIPTTPTDVLVTVIGHTEAEVDFMNFELGCIEGYKFEDMNGNGIYDNGDSPIAGWTVYLSITGTTVTPEGIISFITLIATTTTDADGHYEFCGLGPGMYVVSEETRTDWVPTTATSETVQMTSGAEIRVHDFLNFELGEICGYKFEDLNSNGIWDEGEPAIDGWPIFMVKDDLPEVYETWTNENGYWCFEGLLAETYFVFEDVLDGWTPTTPTGHVVTITSGAHVQVSPFGNFENVCIPILKYDDVNGNGVYDNGDEPIAGWMFTISGPAFDVPLVVFTGADGTICVDVNKAGLYTIVEEDVDGWAHVNPADGMLQVDVTSGILVETQKFGNFYEGKIIGHKFYDWNLNGIWDVGEEGLQGWLIWIQGYPVIGAPFLITRLTDSNGYFEADGLPAGVYFVSERLEAAPPGWIPTTLTEQVLLIESGSLGVANFGNAVFGQICGYKFFDKDLDGVRDDNEPGLAGWTITLTGLTTQGVPVEREEVTDVDGYFCFEDLQPGTYEIDEVQMPGWQATVELPLEIDVSGAMVFFDIVVEIGNIQYAKICGYKFLDTYESKYPFWPNGLFDDDEFGIGNWIITLQGRTTEGVLVDRVAYTDNDGDLGHYCFDNLLPGTYWVNETLMQGFYATRPIANLVIIPAHPIGPVNIRIDFGNLLPSPDPEINFVMKAGWNLWSSPMTVAGLTAKGLLEKIGPNGLMVTMLDKATGKYGSYVAGDPLKWDFPIELGKGYYVWVNGDSAFTLVGVLAPNAAIPVEAGWNILGYTQLEPMMASELLSKVSGTSGWILVELDHTGKYRSYVSGDPAKFDFVVSPGKAYYLWVDGTGSVAY